MQPADGNTILARVAIIATATVFGLTYSLSAALIALDLAERGLGEGLIGANAAMHAVGVLAMAFLLPRLTAFFGLRRSVIGSLALAALLLCLFPAMPIVWLWFPLRILLGAASEVLFVLSETWLNALSTESSRARTMGAYTAAMSVGFALGPLILSVAGSQGFLPYGIGAGLALCAAAFVVSPSITAPVIEQPHHSNPFRYIRLAPVAMAATALNAAVETAGLTFLTLYAMSVGWVESDATQLMTVMMFGAIVLQLPIGWLGDKMDRQKLIIGLAVLSAVGAAAWPWALAAQWAIYPLLFVWGGLFVGIYTMMLTIIGSRFSGSEIVGIYAAMGLFWGVGALVGPTLAGFAMQVTTHGLVAFVALACALFAGAALKLRSPPADDGAATLRTEP
ncbi:MFS transporter [Ancylobacter oerskovii]|uniref:MFS transporter n=1 Tax=Ancylobacter oerskovii TaxID=459519 RepID=A0ABW4YVV7_9HYPH|nr:MFS transporter [Ancylobacter oerskovii]MBS7544246.1 MFS transporter [Ancylobacter oerskovii]